MNNVIARKYLLVHELSSTHLNDPSYQIDYIMWKDLIIIYGMYEYKEKHSQATNGLDSDFDILRDKVLVSLFGVLHLPSDYPVMGKLELFSILWDSPHGVYCAGEILHGRVIVHINTDMKMKGIWLTLSGGANVSWDETTSTGDNRKTITYDAMENYFNIVLTLSGKAPGERGDDHILPEGQYEFPFSLQLPQVLPSSFEGKYGYVRYAAKATIDRPWRFNYNTTCAFTVVGILDLNTQQNAMTSFTQSKQKTLCCLCCRSGPISATLSIPRLGYVPGESIPVFAEITNMSNRNVASSKVELIQFTKFYAENENNTSFKEITRMRRGRIPAGGCQVWNGELLQIPAVLPSYLPGCRIIDIQYFLKLVIEPSGPSRRLEIPVEIMIGTIPHRDAFPQRASSRSRSRPSAPPSYEDVVFGK